MSKLFKSRLVLPEISATHWIQFLSITTLTQQLTLFSLAMDLKMGPPRFKFGVLILDAMENTQDADLALSL
jgi:hypothetical protein